MKFRVKEFLKSSGKSMEWLASELGCSRQNLTKTLANNPTVGTLERIAAALGVSVAELFDEGESPERESASAARVDDLQENGEDGWGHGQDSACGTPGKFQLKRIMEERRLTITDVANKTGITNANISRILHGKASPTLETIERIARALEIEPYELLKGTSKRISTILRCPKCGAELTVSAEGME